MKDWQFDYLCIERKNVIACFAYCALLYYDKYDLLLTEGTSAFGGMWPKTEGMILPTEEALCLMLRKTLKSYDFASVLGIDWTKKLSVDGDIIAQNMAHLLWKDAAADARVRQFETNRPLLYRILDWFH